MDLISQFVARYRKELDFYEQACRLAAQILDAHLQQAGIRAIVTSRAKSPSRLEGKIRQRSQKSSYSAIEDIYEDIVDLAGVRVALYFPAEREAVVRIIRALFFVSGSPREFPASSSPPTYSKRFSGYWATHYRARLADSSLSESQKRYAEAMIEIQVASVLMHAWSEVEHDLVYKPLQGNLSDDEYAILDELNGLVLAGEIALERLQRAGEQRVSVAGRKYTSHYDLAASLLETARGKLVDLDVHDSSLGRVDLLFELLRVLDLNSPEQLRRYVSALHTDLERRPLAEQVIDQILAENPQRYATFDSIRSSELSSAAITIAPSQLDEQNSALGEFMQLWIKYENLIRSYAAKNGATGAGVTSMRILQLLTDIPQEVKEDSENLRRFRNELVHGSNIADADKIRAYTSALRKLVAWVESLPKSQSKTENAKKSPPRKKH